MLAARKAYMNIEFKNPLEGIQNPYVDLENPYAENLYEDLTVDRQGADYLDNNNSNHKLISCNK